MKKYLIAVVIILSLVFAPTSAFAAANPAVCIVNPVTGSTTTANNLLISVKITKPQTINVTAYEKKIVVNGVEKSINSDEVKNSNTLTKDNLKNVTVMDTETFSCNNNLSFYTKQIDITPGLYEVKVDTIGKDGKIKYTNYSFVNAKENDSSPDLFKTEQSGTFKFIQNVLKSIF
ncbi:hypothetical protein [Anaerovorax odorimutans]|uniref:hypothetical protein n=1 Tax=Anaerovorax odorimutans TaxID=109327 RepID=UPI0003F83DE8|nr:hypothetical protein [Anaerovorax odorimutans]